jgi:hypothetical protein
MAGINKLTYLLIVILCIIVMYFIFKYAIRPKPKQIIELPPPPKVIPIMHIPPSLPIVHNAPEVRYLTEQVIGTEEPPIAQPHVFEILTIHFNGQVLNFDNMNDLVNTVFNNTNDLRRMENSHDTNVVAGIRDLTNKILAVRNAAGQPAYNPSLDLTDEILMMIKQLRSESDYNKCIAAVEMKSNKDDVKKIIDTRISSYSDITPRQIMSLVYQQAVICAKSTEELNNVIERIVIALIESFDENVCPTGMYNRIITSTELFNYDNIETLVMTDEYIKEAIMSKVAQLRDQALDGERAAGDPVGLIASFDTILTGEQEERLEILRKQVIDRADAEFGHLPYYKKKKQEISENIFG